MTITPDVLRAIREDLVAAQKAILEFAKANQKCLRKAVGCAIGIVNHVERSKPDSTTQSGYRFSQVPKLNIFKKAHNGPSAHGHVCSNVVGNCGCAHAEPRAVMRALHSRISNDHILICTYSPCTNCANIINDSQIIQAVVYDILTEHDKRGVELLKLNGVLCVSMKELE